MSESTNNNQSVEFQLQPMPNQGLTFSAKIPPAVLSLLGMFYHGETKPPAGEDPTEASPSPRNLFAGKAEALEETEQEAQGRIEFSRREWQAIKHGLGVAIETRNSQISEHETTEILRKMEAAEGRDPVEVNPPAWSYLEKIQEKAVRMTRYRPADPEGLVREAEYNVEHARRSLHLDEVVQARLSLIEAAAWIVHALDALEGKEGTADSMQQPPGVVPGLQRIRQRWEIIQDRGETDLIHGFLHAAQMCLKEADKIKGYEHQRHEYLHVLEVCGAWCALEIDRVLANQSTT